MLERAGKNVPNWATSSLTSVIFLGSVFGQLVLGRVPPPNTQNESAKTTPTKKK